MSLIDKEKLEHLSRLARIQISDPQQEEKLVRDGADILKHFEELEELDTNSVEPLIGATNLINIASRDEVSLDLVGKGVSNFPESQDGHLVVPAVKDQFDDL